MASEDRLTSKDLLVAAQLAARRSAGPLVKAWLYVPIVDKLLDLVSVSFPASVACLIILFLSLLLLEQVIGEHRTRYIVALIEISGGWLLRWINVFFTPSFVLLPLSPLIGGIEVVKIIAVFVIGFLVTMALAAYMARGLQLLLGSSKRAITERAKGLGPGIEHIPMTTIPRVAEAQASREGSEFAVSTEEAGLQPSQRSQDSLTIHQDFDGTLPASNEHQADLPTQVPVLYPRAIRCAAIIPGRLDLIIYAMLFVIVGIPVFYTVGYAMPLQLTFSVLTYFTAMSLPQTWREYRTGANYLKLWDGTHQLPGSGDIFSSVLDASIVSLALPMYQYRRELKEHFLAIVLPNVLISIGSLFAYPYICFTIGMSAQRSLAFAARSLTLALAIPAIGNLGGDSNTVAALAIVSGITGVLIGQRMLALMKIPDDDYVTRGVTMGANSSAIATALLLRTDPRAAALSSLSMSIFGAITVLLTSIPPIAAVVRSLVGL
ncbi:LrgB-like family-domain-containing protein [Xylariaceae sp. FL1651]|nr:LrgB-like family-domain-containing protein [Xylariaceae sp. FL1651]